MRQMDRKNINIDAKQGKDVLSCPRYPHSYLKQTNVQGAGLCWHKNLNKGVKGQLDCNVYEAWPIKINQNIVANYNLKYCRFQQ